MKTVSNNTIFCPGICFFKSEENINYYNSHKMEFLPFEAAAAPEAVVWDVLNFAAVAVQLVGEKVSCSQIPVLMA